MSQDENGIVVVDTDLCMECPCLHIIGVILLAVAELYAVRHPWLLLWAGFLFLSAAEVWGRLVFYKSHCRIGL